ncbi:hypothetical protein ACIRG5_25775 [Lentzea sp. NPDC102401]|uniref:hypothetical protein n=1 Tax=Lentzea sp. NPDC102401 TaxID=3364128 RepID=UPI0038274A8D
MRLSPRAFVMALTFLAGVAVAVAQSPNFSSLTTVVNVLTSDSTHSFQVTVPLPYREPQRTLLAPVPASRFDVTWPLSERGIGMRTDHATEG